MVRILVAVAWPYASGPRHIGHACSTFIPADVFSRYHRMKGDDVLMVGGSDMHGTPTTVRADAEGVAPEVIASRFHALHAKNIEQLGVQYDLYWNTAEPNHKRDVQDIFLRLRESGRLDERMMTSPFCTAGNHFLPDRYVEGTCPNCEFPSARGDQCERCGKLLDPFDQSFFASTLLENHRVATSGSGDIMTRTSEGWVTDSSGLYWPSTLAVSSDKTNALRNPRCRIHNTRPVPRMTKHAFFKLSSFQDQLRSYIASRRNWRTPVLTFTQAWLDEGLRDRPITRDLDWGIEVPLPGWEGKRIYVWFEAVMGYLTASRECWRRKGDPDRWRDWWYSPDAQHFYFVGKDNVPFHTIMWPAILMGYDSNLVLPVDVTATQFMNISGEKMSASRGQGVWLSDLLERFDPDAIRYYAVAAMPELKDSEFSWEDFAQRNNSELLAVYGNFAHRALTFAAKNFDNRVPEAAFLDAADKAMIRNVEEQAKKVAQNLEYVHFQQAMREAIQLARFGNQYFDGKAPWDLIRKDRAACGTALHVALHVSRALALIMAPFLPFSSQRLWHALGYDDDVHRQSWDATLEDLPAGQALRVGKPLFAKIELAAEAPPNEADALDVRVAQILAVRDHPQADKLYVLDVDLGAERRQIVAGIKENYAKEELQGRKIALLANLQPARLRGVESNGMLLAGEEDTIVGLVLPGDDAPVGAQLLGRPGAPRIAFDDFRKLRLVVGEGSKVVLLSTSGEAIPLKTGERFARVDKGIKEGAAVH